MNLFTSGVQAGAIFLIATISLVGCEQRTESVKPKPNIIIFYVDDLGYADVGCYGAKGVKTPNIDFLANNGVKFTDGHCSAATCTPSRYSLLTGNHAFRRKAAVLPGDAPLLIDTAQQTLPKMLKSAGYETAVIGKWHLGLGYGAIDWNKKIIPGANEVGFDYSFLIPATGDRVPTVYLENGSVVNLDPADPISVSYSERIDTSAIGLERPDLLRQGADPQHSKTIVNGISRIGYMTGGENARWVDEDFPYVLTDKSGEFISNTRKPFLLYYAFHDIHVPRLPHKNFVGKSAMGPRGDAIAQVDWVVGDLVEELKKKGILENTLIIFTSDNGPVLDDGYVDEAVEKLGDHNPSGPFRGGKYSVYEAGTRVPTIVYWKDQVAPRESGALVSQLDLLASLASLVGGQVAPEVVDSENRLDSWLGKSDQGRDVLLEEAFTLAIRKKQWKYIRPYTGTTPDWLANKDVEHGLGDSIQLYDLASDLGEQNNLAKSNPEKVMELDQLLTGIVAKTSR